MIDLVPLPNGIDTKTLFYVLAEGTDYKKIIWCTKTENEDRCMEATRNNNTIEILPIGKATSGILYKKLSELIKDKRNYIVKMENLTDVIVIIL